MPDKPFIVHSEYQPAGDQPQAIDALARGIERGDRYQTLLGVTGSGKTFTLANMIAKVQRPTLVVSHNKTLAAQLYSELKSFFPENAVEYFVSYYDYYQPEAYIPQTDTYIAKDSAINDGLERLRLAATGALLERRDVIVVASVSCLYGLGSPEDFSDMRAKVLVSQDLSRDELLRKLVEIQYTRNDIAPERGQFRAAGDTLEIYPSHREDFLRVEFWGDTVERVTRHDPTTRKMTEDLQEAIIFPAKHFVLPQERVKAAEASILQELDEQVAKFERENHLVEAQRIHQRTTYDMEMLKEIGYCSGIENYSRHLTGRAPGSRPYTLVDYFPDDFVTIIDESHATLPQVQAMARADRNRKQTLVDYGFRLPSAKDNRPLNFEEFNSKIEQTLYVSATPAVYELGIAEQKVIQVIRPTGLLDPPVEVRPLKGQIDDLMEEVRSCSEKGDRVLATTLTKRTAEDLAQYLRDSGLRVEYLHSDIDTLERIAILSRLRKGEFDALIGINLLREGLDLPEVALVAVLDADKEGFLRSATALIQTAGRTARHVMGRVILYADKMTDSMRKMIEITERRRTIQIAYNEEHQITPRSVNRMLSEDDAVRSIAGEVEAKIVAEKGADYDVAAAIRDIQREMLEAAEALEFERAAALRDELRELQTSCKNDTNKPISPKTKRRERK